GPFCMETRPYVQNDALRLINYRHRHTGDLLLLYKRGNCAMHNIVDLLRGSKCGARGGNLSG
ncbi:hypothetical protein, partial [Shigella sonnei]|uniref:hypothetical protein n=1 Tax=Shigella sonnei TaxID=624 RepID=UPI003C6F8899